MKIRICLAVSIGRAFLVLYQYSEVVSEVGVSCCVWRVLKLELAEALRQEYVTRHGSHVGLIGTATMQTETP